MIEVGGSVATSFTQAQVDAGIVVFIHDGSDTTIGSFDVSLADGGEDGAMPATGSVSIVITPVDDAPSLDVNDPATVAEGAALDITTTLLSGSDPDTADADLIYTITTGTANGVIEVGGIVATSFTQSDLAAGIVQFIHDGSETLSDSFEFTLGDATTTLASATFAITVTPVNDAPELTITNPPAILEGASSIINGGVLAGSDADDGVFDLTYSASNLLNGVIEVGGSIATSFTQAQVDAGIVVFIHCLLYTSPSPRDLSTSRMPSSA